MLGMKRFQIAGIRGRKHPSTFASVIAVFAVLFVTFLSIPVKADEDLAGAIDAWLADKDEIAMPLLARLARDGNNDARLLLGRIADRPGAFSPYMASLSRKERNRLLKAPGGISGVSWLGVISDENEIAAAHIKAKDVKNGVPGIAELLELGEAGPSVTYLFRQLSMGNQTDLLELVDRERLPESTRFIVWEAAFEKIILHGDSVRPTVKGTLEDFEAELKRFDLHALLALGSVYGHLSPAKKLLYAPAKAVSDELTWRINPELVTTPSKRLSLTTAAAVLMNSECTKPIVRLCRQECPETTQACVATLFGGGGGYLVLAGLQTPVEKLIPSSTYFTSKRYQADLLRVVYDTFDEKGWDTPPGTLERSLKGKVDQCIADKVLASSAALK
jgi:hypothetical protein